MAGIIRPHPVKDRGAYGEEVSVGVEGEGTIDHGVAGVIVGQQMLAATAAPFDRPAERLGGEQQADVFRIRLFLAAERTADIVGANMQPGAWDAHRVLAQRAHEELHALGRRDQFEALLFGIIPRQATARLDGIGHDALVEQLEPGDMGGAREGLIDGRRIAEMIAQADVFSGIRPQHRRTPGRGRRKVGDGCQRLDVEHDLLGGVGGLRWRVRDNHGNRIADMADPADRQRQPVGGDRRIHQEARQWQIRDRAKTTGAHVVADIGAKHAGSGARRLQVDPVDDPVRDGRADERRVHLARQIEIIGEASGTGEQPAILTTPDRFGNQQLAVS